MTKDFITVTPDNGSNNLGVKFKADVNNTTSVKSTIITISGGGLSESVNCNQKAGSNKTILLAQTGLRNVTTPQLGITSLNASPMQTSSTTFSLMFNKAIDIDRAQGSNFVSDDPQLNTSFLSYNGVPQAKITFMWRANGVGGGMSDVAYGTLYFKDGTSVRLNIHF